MSKALQIPSEMCTKVCEEFLQIGLKKDIDPRTLKESYSIQKSADGKWFKRIKNELHPPPIITLLNLEQMPNLKILTDMIDEHDFSIKTKGGIIFISETLVYKIKKGTQTPLFVTEDPKERIPGRNQKLCDEMVSLGLTRDRHRVEETYILSKSANGEWSTTSSHENHSGTKKILNLAKMPELKILASSLNKIDIKFQLNGGRVFITPNRIYRLSNKLEVDFKI